jgi:hypothetical protein
VRRIQLGRTELTTPRSWVGGGCWWRRDVCIGGADQAFHNVLFYRGQLPGAHAVVNGAGQVYTVGVFGKFGMTLRRDAEGFVVNDDGRVRFLWR